MPVLRDFKITIDRNEVLKRQTKGQPNDNLNSIADWAIERAQELIKPAVAYAVYDSEGVEDEELVLQGGIRLRLGPHADLAAGAKKVIASVATIGPNLEAEVRRLMAGPDVLKGYVLDCAGVVAVGQTAMQLREVIQKMAEAEGWGVSPALYPGSPMGWPLKGQRDLVALVPVDEIGVHLNPSYLLVPQKSSSSLVGIGPEYSEKTIGALCHWCALQDSCWRRRERVEAAQGSTA